MVRTIVVGSVGVVLGLLVVMLIYKRIKPKPTKAGEEYARMMAANDADDDFPF